MLKLIIEKRSGRGSNNLQRLDRLQLWSDSLLMKFSPTKCSVLHFALARVESHNEMRIGYDYHPLEENLQDILHVGGDLGADLLPSLSLKHRSKLGRR